MTLTTGSQPVRHFVIDDFVAPRRDWTVPPADARVWEARYDNDCERGKRTTRELSWGGWPADVMSRLNGIDVLRHCTNAFGVIAYPDSLFWGGGLQVLAPGGHLATHLDGVLHPKRPGLRRAVQLVCFCHPAWEPAWGGQFYLANPLGDVVCEFEAAPGRLIAFENTDLAYHGVCPVAGPAERVTVATTLLADARPSDTRARALFLPRR